jgi:putative aminopeptidase FrvX
MKKKSEKFLEEYLNSSSPVGYEVQNGGQKVWIDYIKPFVKKVEVDNYGTAIAITGNMKSKYKVVIEAHADEIGWAVNYITPQGYIKVIRNGGSDTLIAPSMRVNLWGKKGAVKGIFGHPAIHIHYRNEKADLDSIFIDVGASSKEEVEKMGIEIGTPITFRDELEKLGKNYYTGRALDNRIGGFTIAEVARKLSESKVELPFKLYIVNAVQEEVGLRGASIVANNIKPDVAFVCDVCHETTSPAYNPAKEGLFEAGKGGVFAIAPGVQNNLLKMVRGVAERKGIKYQLGASSRITGTDTDAFAYPNGTPSVLMSFPLKYMHTTVETVHKKDVKSVRNTMFEFLKQLDEGHDFKYI